MESVTRSTVSKSRGHTQIKVTRPYRADTHLMDDLVMTFSRNVNLRSATCRELAQLESERPRSRRQRIERCQL